MTASYDLTPLQWRILEVLEGMDRPWTLTGGAALLGFHTHHRATRDVDLFWMGRGSLDDLPDEVSQRLTAAGLSVSWMRRTPGFARASVTDGAETIDVDLVAEPVPTVEPPEERVREGVRLLVDSRHEILVNKLNALVSRSEFRDLDDVRVLLERGGDLDRALLDAPRKDGGFSPLVLAWVLSAMSLDRIGPAAGFSVEHSTALATFRDSLVERLLRAARPPE